MSTGFSSVLTMEVKNKKNKMKKFFYLTILKFSFGIILSISFLGAGNSILFSKKIIKKKDKQK